MDSSGFCKSNLPHLIRAFRHLQDSIQDGKHWQDRHCQDENPFDKNQYTTALFIIKSAVQNAEAFLLEWIAYMKENFGEKGALLAQIEQLRSIDLDSSAATSSGSEHSPQKDVDMKRSLVLQTVDQKQDFDDKIPNEFGSDPEREVPEAISDDEWGDKCVENELLLAREVYVNPLKAIREKMGKEDSYFALQEDSSAFTCLFVPEN